MKCRLLLFGTVLLLALAGTEALHAQPRGDYLTPDPVLNRRLRSGQADPVKVFGIRTTDEGLVIAPELRPGWTWLAAKNLPYRGRRLSFFLYDGRIYMTVRALSPYRRSGFREDITGQVASSVFTIAFHSNTRGEDRAVLFLAAEKETEAAVTVDPRVFGEKRRFRCSLKAGQARLVVLYKLPPSARPVFFPHPAAQRLRRNLDAGWLFMRGDVPEGQNEKLDDSSWQRVSLPHCWNTRDPFDARDVRDGFDETALYYRGPAWYRKYFYVADSLRGRRLFLQFEGANQVAEVWLNGKYLGKHLGGYTGFSFEVTDAVRFGAQKNLLAVRVDNSYNYDIPPHTADFTFYGGLYRDVWLEARRPVFVADLFARAGKISRKSGEVVCSYRIASRAGGAKSALVRFNLVNADGEIEVSAQRRIRFAGRTSVEDSVHMPAVRNPHLWSPDDPYLYSVYATLLVNGRAVDEISVPFGFRWYRFDANRGFFLNGKPLKIHGVNKHQDYFGMGFAVPDSLQVRDLQIIKEMGANFVRLAHYPQDPSVLAACDRLGLMVWEEIPVVNTIGGKAFARNAQNMLREMILRDRNHPSVVLWGLTNESLMESLDRETAVRTVALIRRLNSLAHKLDPSRLTVQAHNRMKLVEVADITDVIGRNRYFGWYGGTFSDFERETSAEHRAHPNWKMLISEYGAGAKRGYHVDQPRQYDFSEDYQLLLHEHYWKVIRDTPWLAGGLVWNAFDFGSYVKLGNIPHINQKGILDARRRPKDLYYFYKSQWTEKPMVYIVSHTRRFISGPPGRPRTFRVYSNCSEVELFVNGKSLGKQPRRYVFLWKVVLQPGGNVLKAVGVKEGRTVVDSIRVTFRPVRPSR